jgi:hypothetical protein
MSKTTRPMGSTAQAASTSMMGRDTPRMRHGREKTTAGNFAVSFPRPMTKATATMTAPTPATTFSQT